MYSTCILHVFYMCACHVEFPVGSAEVMIVQCCSHGHSRELHQSIRVLIYKHFRILYMLVVVKREADSEDAYDVFKSAAAGSQEAMFMAIG
jgi:hypothetical protein